MANRLTDIHVEKIDLVWRGANKRRHTLFKSLSTDKKEDESVDNNILEVLKEASDEDRAEIVKALGIETPEVPKEDDIVIRVLKTLGIKKDEAPPLIQDEQTREAISKLSGDNDELGKKVVALQKKLDEREESDRKAAATARVEKLAALGFTDEDAEALGDIGDAVFQKLEKASGQLATSELFAELGKGGEETSGSESKIRKAAEAIRKDHPDLTQEQAEAQVMKDNPKLYDEYLAENPRQVQ